MFIINPTVSWITILIVFVVYWYLSKQNLETPFEDVRSGLFVSFAEWAAKHTWGMKSMQQRAWKPNLMVPVRDIIGAKGNFDFLRNVLAQGLMLRRINMRQVVLKGFSSGDRSIIRKHHSVFIFSQLLFCFILFGFQFAELIFNLLDTIIHRLRHWLA